MLTCLCSSFKEKQKEALSLLAVLLRMKADKGPAKRSPTFLLTVLGQILLSLIQRADFISDFWNFISFNITSQKLFCCHSIPAVPLYLVMLSHSNSVIAKSFPSLRGTEQPALNAVPAEGTLPGEQCCPVAATWSLLHHFTVGSTQEAPVPAPSPPPPRSFLLQSSGRLLGWGIQRAPLLLQVFSHLAQAFCIGSQPGPPGINHRCGIKSSPSTVVLLLTCMRQL